MIRKKKRKRKGHKTLQCSRCKELKSPLDFPNDKRKSNGYSSYCKSCHTLAVRESRKRNPDSARTAQKMYRESG